MLREDLWQAALAKLEPNLSRPSFHSWFQETGILTVEDGLVTLCVPNGFTKDWLQHKYHKNILHVLRELNQEIKDVSYVVAKNYSPAQSQPKKKTNDTSYKEHTTASIKELSVNPETNLNPRYTFQNFIVGSFNEYAFAAAQSIIKNPGIEHNPLFLYGGVGLGKTHLIQAIGNELLKERPSFKVRYVPAERYMTEIVEAIKVGEMNKLKEKYRTVDLLIMDDIQFISRTEKMQEDFFHTFNALHEKNKQIIISSDRPPNAIPTLEERLRSRFEGGMTTDIGIPDVETRFLILKTKVESKKLVLPDAVIQYIAETIKTNVRELEGALNKVLMASTVSKAPIDVDMVKKIITNHQQNSRKFISTKKIIKAVSEFYDIEEKEILNHSRRRDIVYPRQVAMYLMRVELDISFPAIGERFGGRDHTTAIHSCGKIEQELKIRPELEDELRLIKERIYSA